MSAESDFSKSPRLYTIEPLPDGGSVMLSAEQAHYLLVVMRKGEGTPIRIFNGIDGEFVGRLQKDGKKSASLGQLEKIKDQPAQSRPVHLYFAPIKKDRMAMMIEKAVELGVTDLHPVLTDHTDKTHPNWAKTQAHMIEAAEQCERMDMPTLHKSIHLMQIDSEALVHAAIERAEAPIFSPAHTSDPVAVLIGPEGGWSNGEIEWLNAQSFIHPVSLGPRILRAETAAIFMLSRI